MAKHRRGDWLAPRNRVEVRCPICQKFSIWELKDKDNAFSYLEQVRGQRNDCDHCGIGLKLDEPYAYGWVQN